MRMWNESFQCCMIFNKPKVYPNTPSHIHVGCMSEVAFGLLIVYAPFLFNKPQVEWSLLHSKETRVEIKLFQVLFVSFGSIQINHKNLRMLIKSILFDRYFQPPICMRIEYAWNRKQILSLNFQVEKDFIWVVPLNLAYNLTSLQTKLYTEDWIGLKTLDEAGKVKFINVSGGHLHISTSDMQKYIVPYLEDVESSIQWPVTKSYLSWLSIRNSIKELVGFTEDRIILYTPY